MAALREIRAGLQWTQERMAKELSVSLRTYARQEAAGGDQTLRKLAAFIYKYSQPVAQLADEVVDSRESSGYIQAISKEMVRKNTFEASGHTAP